MATQKWQAEDGTLFSTKKECEAYEKGGLRKNQLIQAIYIIFSEEDTVKFEDREIAEAILKNSKALMKLFGKMSESDKKLF